MSKRLIVSENDIYRQIMKELNDNVLDIEFEMANYYTNDDNDKLYILRQAFNVEDGKFDIVQELDEDTYATLKKRFTAVGINNLNAEILSHPEIVEINYNPIINFLVYAGDGSGDSTEFIANKLAIEEIRARLIHKNFVFKTEQYDLENINSDVKIEQTLKGVYASGEIDYGTLENINGRFYIVISMPLNIFVTNKGEFANSQEFIFSVEDLIDSETNEPKKFKIPLITWHYGKGVDTNDFQLMATKNISGSVNRASEVRGLPNSKAFALTFLVQIDYDNEFLDYIYEESQNIRIKSPLYTITMNTYKYDETQGENILHKTNTRNYWLIQNTPPDELSLGEKIEHVLVFSVAMDLKD